MNFRTEITLRPAKNPVSHQTRIISIGSCFADVMGMRLANYKFSCLANPFGIIYHPIPLLRPLKCALAGENPFCEDLFEHDGRWRNWNFHSRLSHGNRPSLEEKIGETMQTVTTALRHSGLLIVTLGTAIGFRHKERNEIVGNCHRHAQSAFVQEMSTLETLKEEFSPFLDLLFETNPKIQVLLTVSPVRHLRSGLVQNSASKATLRLLCHDLGMRYERLQYFPAYELMIDDLRDYRFYKSDLMHPTQMAEDYIWEKFSSCWLTQDTRLLNSILDDINRDMAHRPSDPEGAAHKHFQEQLLAKMDKIKGQVDLGKEYESIKRQLETGK